MGKISTLAFLLLLVAGCIESDRTVDVEAADAALPMLRARVQDHLGRSYSPDATPRRALLGVDPPVRWNVDNAPVLLFLGLPDSTLLQDLESTRLPARTESRAIAIERVQTPDGPFVRPESPLPPETHFTLAVGAWAETVEGRRIGTPAAFVMKTGSGPNAGAALEGSWPASETSDVPTALPFVGLHFDGNLAPEALEHMRLETDVGSAATPGSTAPSPRFNVCPPLGWPSSGQCVVWKLNHALAGSAEYRIVISADATDVTGAPVGPAEVRFVTAHPDSDDAPPEWLPLSCGVDETALEAGCALVDDRSISLRLAASEPARISWATSAGSIQTIASRGEAELTLTGLTADLELDGALTATDLSGQTVTTPTRVRTTSPLAALTMVEISSNPVGSEPGQEYVELLSSGSVPVSLLGISLSDRSDTIGDVVELSRTVPPGSRVLLVADDFDANVPPAVPPGVPLIRLGTSLASGGLRNGGEPLFLRDAEGRRLATVPAFNVAEGECIQRRDETRLRARTHSDFALVECGPGLRPP